MALQPCLGHKEMILLFCAGLTFLNVNKYSVFSVLLPEYQSERIIEIPFEFFLDATMLLGSVKKKRGGGITGAGMLV